MAVTHRRGTIGVLVVLLAATPASARTQSVGGGGGLPDWVTAWSPATVAGSLPRRLPRAAPAVPTLLYPVEQVGLFWSGGNPGALAWEAVSGRNEISLSHASEDGDYRRPLDPASTAVTSATGLGWQPLGARGAGIGRVSIDRTTNDPGSRSDVMRPYGSSPLVMVDSSTSALRTTGARLEGAGGWRLGEWGVGLALGYDTRRTSTVQAGLVRHNRGVIPGARVGVARRFGGSGIHAGVHAGWQGGEESTDVIAVGAAGRVALLEGYREVDWIFIGQPRYRRTSRSAVTGGAGIGGTLGGGRWVAYADGVTLTERLAVDRSDEPVEDRWATTGATVGAALQLPVLSRRATLTVQARRRTLVGDATLYGDRTGLATDETETSGSAELRYLAPSGAWGASVRASVLSEQRERADSVANMTSNTDGLTPTFHVELTRRLTERLTIIGGYGLAQYDGGGTIPSAEAAGP
ncbi:MAG: DUF6850 family outer membrane beta-barrel protein, partial [Gemmatimonadaceae bacterium]